MSSYTPSSPPSGHAMFGPPLPSPLLPVGTVAGTASAAAAVAAMISLAAMAMAVAEVMSLEVAEAVAPGGEEA